MTPKSPFVVIENLISPLKCEQIVNDLAYYVPDVDSDDDTITMRKHHERSEALLYDNIKNIIPKLESHFDFKHRGTELINFEFHAEGVKPIIECDNSSHIQHKWARVRDRDFSFVVFLSDYQDKTPFDSEYEVYGGKLEFPQHDFGFNPSRGTMIVYPSGPHFLNAFSEIIAGDLYVARSYFSAEIPYFHDPADFPGNYKTWF